MGRQQPLMPFPVMDYSPAGLLIPPPLSPLPPPQGVNLSPLEFFLVFIAAITIPVLIYTLIFAIKCPSASRRSRRSFSGETGPVLHRERAVPAAEVKVRKEAAEGDCPVCLSSFREGEEVKQLSACSHYFHAQCIDAWLRSHASCPVCRASIAVKRPPVSNVSASSTRDSDHLQGLPDASSLV